MKISIKALKSKSINNYSSLKEAIKKAKELSAINSSRGVYAVTRNKQGKYNCLHAGGIGPDDVYLHSFYRDGVRLVKLINKDK